MLVTPWFIFLHNPKTAGGTVKEVLKRVLPPGSIKQPSVTVLDFGGPKELVHPGWVHLPPDAQIPILTYVRNPWDWYVSWWRWTARRGRRNRWGQTSFDEAVRAACDGEVGRSWALERLGPRGRPHLAAASKAGVDFCSAWYREMTGDQVNDPRLTVGRFELLAEDLISMLTRCQVPLVADPRDAFSVIKPIHKTERGPYQEYYDDELRDLVGTACGTIIERYSYTF